MTEPQLSELDHIDEWLHEPLLYDNSSGLQQQPGIFCPDCSYKLQAGNALHLVCCTACGCSFCGRCKALYLLQPGSDTQRGASSNTALRTAAALDVQQQTVLAAVEAAGGDLLATCSCEPVDKAAIKQQWGPEAVAYWPTGQLQQQLLLLLLLQQHQQQVVPLLSQQLLQQLQQQWWAAQTAVLQWQHVLTASQAVHQQQQQQQQQVQADERVSNQQWQTDCDTAAEAEQHVIPTSATPAFQVVCDGVSPGHTPMDMDGCTAAADHTSAQALSAAQTAAAASQVATGAAHHSRHRSDLQQQHVDEMQVDEHASHQQSCADEQQAQLVHVNTVLQHQHQQQRGDDTIASALLTSAAEESSVLQQQNHEQLELMRLAQEVLAIDTSVDHIIEGEDMVDSGRQGEETTTTYEVPAALGSAVTRPPPPPPPPPPAAAAAARCGPQGSFKPPQHPQQHTITTVDESVYAEDQLDLKDFEAPHLLPAVAEQQSETVTPNEDQQWPPRSSRDGAQKAAVLPGKGGRAQLVGYDGEGANGLNQAGSTTAPIPQLSDFGLQLAPPLVTDEPVVLIAAGDQEALPFWQQ